MDESVEYEYASKQDKIAPATTEVNNSIAQVRMMTRKSIDPTTIP